MTYIFLYLITNLFHTYILFKFMLVIFGDPVNSRFKTWISYLIYFIVISSVYLALDIPILVMTFNLIFIFLITLNYDSSLKQRIAGTIFIYTILAVIETLFVLIHGYTGFSIFKKSDFQTISLIAIKVFSYIFVLVLGHYKKTKKQFEVPILYSIEFVFLPLSILYWLISLLSSNLSQIIIVIGVFLLLALSIIIFRIYDELSLLFELKAEKEILSQQSTYLKNQINLMENSNRNIRTIKHDLNNHLSALESLVKQNSKDGMLEYILDLKKATITHGEYAQSGVMIIDSILNYKISDAVYYGIKVDLTLTIPSNLPLKNYDVVIILGNLLDNSIEASQKIDISDRYISIVIKYKQNILFITIKNRFNQALVNANLTTSKSDKDNHGLGLNQIKKIIEEYNGSLETAIQEDIFTANAILYIE